MTADERSVGEIERELRLRSDSGFPSASEWEYWTQRVASAAEFDVICGCQTSKGRSCALSPVRRGVCEDEVGHIVVGRSDRGSRLLFLGVKLSVLPLLVRRHPFSSRNLVKLCGQRFARRPVRRSVSSSLTS